MSLNKPNFHQALHDFNDARLKASMQEVLARLTGKSNELLSYDEVAQKLKLVARSERGVHEIPVKSIVGSVGRYTDFTRTFLPRSTTDRQRWARVKASMEDQTGWPPIEVYQVGDVYFVLDGNHRVSIARQEGFEFIEAHIIEVQTNISITPDIQPDDLILKAEYADFLDATNIASLCPGVDFSVTAPGQYGKLREHISVHRYFMGFDLQREVSHDVAVTHWYETVYLPLIEPIRERGLLRWFPGRTETDLYLWVAEHRAVLEKELGWSLRPEAVAADLASRINPKGEDEVGDTGSWRMTRSMDRYVDTLFHEILVPVSGADEGWSALEQAIIIAQKERSDLHGLHVVPSKRMLYDVASLAVQKRFNTLCEEEGIHGKLAIVRGEVVDQVCERALLSDLVVLTVAHPPVSGLASLGSSIRHIIWRSARPILSVPAGKVSLLDNALLAFDGSLKSKEALFVAAYMAEQWKTRLTVFTSSVGSAQKAEDAQNYARTYLEFHEIEATYMNVDGPLDVLFDIIEERKINLVLMGGYSGTVLHEVIIGSAVNYLLRNVDCPLLICR